MSSNSTQENESSSFEEIQRMSLFAVAIPSALASLSVILVLLYIPDLRERLLFNIVFWMMISDLVCSLQYMIPVWLEDGFDDEDGDPGILCVAQGSISQFAYLAVFCWNGVVSWVLYTRVVIQSQIKIGSMWRYHVCVWPLCAVLTLVPLRTYGRAGAWCWISSDENGDSIVDPHIYRMVCFYAIVWIIASAEIFVFVRIAYRICQIPGEGVTRVIRKALMNIVRAAAGYPAALIITWLPPTISRLYQMVVSSDGNDVLSLLHAVFMGLQGVGFAIVFYWNPLVKTSLTRVFQEYVHRDFQTSKKKTPPIMAPSSPRRATRISLASTPGSVNNEDVSPAALEEQEEATGSGVELRARKVSVSNEDHPYSPVFTVAL